MLGFQSNPLVVRLTGKRSWPSLRAACWLAFGLGLIGLALTSAVLLNARDAIGPLTFLPFSLIAFSAFVPPIVALIAATLTVRDTHSESYELLTATDISDTAIVQGYVFAALYKLRLLLAMTMGAIPAIVVSVFDLVMRDRAALCPFHVSSGSACEPPPVTLGLVWLMIVIGLWGLNGAAAALGVNWALRWQSEGAAVTFATVVMFMLSLLAAGFWLAIYLPATTVPLPTWLVAFVWMYSPYAAAIGIMQNGERWTRRQ